jgi:hypothetical protein
MLRGYLIHGLTCTFTVSGIPWGYPLLGLSVGLSSDRVKRYAPPGTDPKGIPVSNKQTQPPTNDTLTRFLREMGKAIEKARADMQATGPKITAQFAEAIEAARRNRASR